MMETLVSSSKDFRFLNISFTPQMECFFSNPGASIFVSYAATNTVVLLPFTILILLHGLQECWQKKSSTLSHSDCFTYNLASMKLFGVSGCVICIYAIHVQQPIPLELSLILYSFTSFGETVFQVLTSVEHYLAVVHPLTYLRLRKERGTRMRNVTVGCGWMLSIGLTGMLKESGIFLVLSFSFLMLSLIVVCFCSLSVLRVLIRAGPGEQGEGPKRAHQGKKKAFYTIVLILATLLPRFAGSMIWAVIFQLEGALNCVLLTAKVWCHLPSSLVLPLLFLQRVGKFKPLEMCRIKP